MSGKLYFRYGAMGASKTANALMVQYNYEERGKKAILVKPEKATRDGETQLKSRIGLTNDAISFNVIREAVDEYREKIKAAKSEVEKRA